AFSKIEMAKGSKGSKGQGSYSADRGDDSCFKPDKSFFNNAQRAGEGESQPELRDAISPKHN
ncbi:MAG TPA: hypothetical protein VNO18_00230, partial [Xanthobacteraceae bacterium]|nr:hypothetical protein [Xanthobacteraceae bacterium]